jgi:Domain of unknown function (DUF6457)
MADWLEHSRQRLEKGIEAAGDLSLSPADVELLLEFSRSVAHESGERTNVPVVCYLAGLAHGRSTGRTLEDVVAIALGRNAP